MVGNSIFEIWLQRMLSRLHSAGLSFDGRTRGARHSPSRLSLLLSLGLLALCGGPFTASGALQFDVFLGFDSLVPEASWFPVVCEIKNDGAAFTGVVEVGSGQFNEGQTRRLVVELPTGTLKRVVIPVFSTARSYSSWDVRLLDERGRVRAEQTGMRPRKLMASSAPLIGALTRTVGGTPVIRPILPNAAELQPAAARLQPTIFPDNPLVLEAMSAIYLNSEKAPDLKVAQVNALLAWLNAGGHLIVAVEQISEITATPWLRNLFPVDLKDMQSVERHPELQQWLQSASWATNVPYAGERRGASSRNRNAPRPGVTAGNPFSELSDDPAFEGAALQVAVGTMRDGSAVVSAGDVPLMVTAPRGRGRVTALLFSPEREPFRSWKNLPTFWAKLIEVPGAWYASTDFGQPGGWSSDGIFGAMIDSRQVHKLPVGWLLLLLMVYLVVIGPLDQYWLKRIGKPMLTWITFPCYVVLFSLLIYFIGYRLRAGESEWNELHLVDVLQKGDRAELRGQTYASVYSPANQKYTLESRQKFATFRGEFVGRWSGGQSGEKASVMQEGDSFKADIFVPVWTSQLYITDWWQPAALPLNATVVQQSNGWQVRVENHTDRNLTSAQVVIDGYVMGLGELAAHSTKTFTVSRERATPLKEFVVRHAGNFQNAVQSRQRTFGGEESGRIDDLPNGTMASSFLSQMGGMPNAMRSFITPPGLDLSPVAEHGSAILLAWAGDYSPVKPLYQFSPRRSHRNTLWRMAVPVQSPQSTVRSPQSAVREPAREGARSETKQSRTELEGRV
jgi:hypothetical protein